MLRVQLELLNRNPTKKVEYQSWLGKDFSFDRDYATLNDNFGNRYKLQRFSDVTPPVGAILRPKSIYPSELVTEVLVFEMPLSEAAHLDLELPATNYGGEGI